MPWNQGGIVGSFGNPNLYAIVLAMIIPIGLMLVFQLKKELLSISGGFRNRLNGLIDYLQLI